jgi:Mce-associated membrane protein
MSQPLAVAAAAVAEAVATGSQQSFLSGPAEPQERSGGNAVRLVTVIAGVLAIAAVVVLVIFDRSSAHDHSVDKARAAALVAARSETATALSYNYQTLDADFTKAEQGMSNTFRAKYAKTAATEVTPLAQKNQATSVGTIAAAGVISASSSKVSVLVFADQTNTNKLLGDKSRLDRSVIEVTMVKQSGHWVIDNLQPF